MRVFLAMLILNAFSHVSHAQVKYYTKTGKISFYSKAPLENIDAHNAKAVSVYDAATGQIEFSVLIKGFEFEKAKMQEHFNENYLESDKYPKAVFVGSVSNANTLNLTVDGVYTVQIKGSLTMHGIAKPQQTQAVFTVRNGVLSAVSEFTINLPDYNIGIPALVADKISRTVRIVVSVPAYQPLGSKG